MKEPLAVIKEFHPNKLLALYITNTASFSLFINIKNDKSQVSLLSEPRRSFHADGTHPRRTLGAQECRHKFKLAVLLKSEMGNTDLKTPLRPAIAASIRIDILLQKAS
jgi:hypothetical protein